MSHIQRTPIHNHHRSTGGGGNPPIHNYHRWGVGGYHDQTMTGGEGWWWCATLEHIYIYIMRM